VEGQEEVYCLPDSSYISENMHLNPTVANIDTIAFSKAKRKRAFDAKCQASIDAASASVKKQKEDKATNQKLRALMKAALTTAFMKKVAVDTRIAEMNEFITNLDLLEKYGSGVYSPEALPTQKLKVFEQLSPKVFEQLSQRAPAYSPDWN
jgi:hypothetical protein